MDQLDKIILAEGNNKAWVYKCKNGVDIKCEIIRNPLLGFWCGYIEIDHLSSVYSDGGVSGFNYSEYERGVRVLGFDCGGFGDLIPFASHLLSTSNVKTYKDINYTIKKCENLAEELSETIDLQKYRARKILEILK